MEDARSSCVGLRRVLGLEVVVVEFPQTSGWFDERAAFGPRFGAFADESREVGEGGGVLKDVGVAGVAADFGVDEFEGADLCEHRALGLWEVFDAHGTDAALASKEPIGESQGLVFFGEVDNDSFGGTDDVLAEEPLDEDLKIQIGGGEDKGGQLERRGCVGWGEGAVFGRDSVSIESRGSDGEGCGAEGAAHLVVQLSDGGERHVGASAVRDDMDPLYIRVHREHDQQSLEVDRRELARFAVVGVALEAARTRGPGVDDGDAFSPAEVPRLRQSQDGVVEGVVVSVNEEQDFLAFGAREPRGEQVVEGLLFLLELCECVSGEAERAVLDGHFGDDALDGACFDDL